jgi:hypothetical protein
MGLIASAVSARRLLRDFLRRTWYIWPQYAVLAVASVLMEPQAEWLLLFYPYSLAPILVKELVAPQQRVYATMPIGRRDLGAVLWLEMVALPTAFVLSVAFLTYVAAHWAGWFEFVESANQGGYKRFAIALPQMVAFQSAIVLTTRRARWACPPLSFRRSRGARRTVPVHTWLWLLAWVSVAALYLRGTVPFLVPLPEWSMTLLAAAYGGLVWLRRSSLAGEIIRDRPDGPASTGAETESEGSYRTVATASLWISVGSVVGAAAVGIGLEGLLGTREFGALVFPAWFWVLILCFSTYRLALDSVPSLRTLRTLPLSSRLLLCRIAAYPAAAWAGVLPAFVVISAIALHGEDWFPQTDAGALRLEAPWRPQDFLTSLSSFLSIAWCGFGFTVLTLGFVRFWSVWAPFLALLVVIVLAFPVALHWYGLFVLGALSVALGIVVLYIAITHSSRAYRSAHGSFRAQASASGR